MSLHNYWPTQEEVDRCIKTEAETVADEVLLAVHQEFPLAYATVGPDGRVVSESRKVASEADLLRHLLGNAPEGSLVVPITGASGVGKSHLIRLLDARLRRHPNASRYLIIRIPKSASLRRVVELILEAEPLKSSTYDGVRGEFEKALADVPLSRAVTMFQAELKIALEEYALTVRQQLKQSPTDQTLREHLHVAQNLPLLLTDASTVIYFNEEVLPRIIHRSVEGVRDEAASIDPTDSQFKASDFDFPDRVEISRASIAVRNFYQLTFSTLGGQGKVTAAEVLNQVVDQATRQLYKLNGSLGGKTLGEVIGDIRRLLLAEDPTKELIILVEDFAALVGIQDTLAKILIQHGETDGKRTHATIRSAIAVTDGYLAGRDTLATRAGREWIVESRFESEAEVLSRTKRLVAFYLNAARHGATALKAMYQEASLGASDREAAWAVPIYSDGTGENESVLNAFGAVKNVPLFPFTESAIECLARSAMSAGNTLVFTPRFVIKNVIREVLINGRDAYLAKQFPPVGINGKPLAFAVADWLKDRNFAPDLRSRYERFISIWGNQPATETEIGCIPAPVFEAFDLPLPNITTSVKKKPLEKTGPGNNLPPPEVQDARSKAALAYKEALERWVQNKTLLEQKVANEIRKAIASLLNQRIDWSAAGLLRTDIKYNLFSLPNAGGEANLVAEPIKVTDTTDDPDGRLRGEFFALLRYAAIYDYSTDYDEADDDFARVGNLIDRLLPAVVARLRLASKKHTRAAIALLAMNGRLLGLLERGRTAAAVSSFLFGEVASPVDLTDSAPQAFKDWQQLQRDAFQVRKDLTELVLQTSGCFQGAGTTPLGVDIVGLIESYPEEGTAPDLADITFKTPELRTKLTAMRTSAVGARVKTALQAATSLQAIIAAELGPDFDKQATIDAIKAVAISFKEMGAWPTQAIGFSSSEFFDVCESFRNAAVKEALATLADVMTEGAGGEAIGSKTISRVAQMPLVPLLAADRFIKDSGVVLRVAAAHAKVMESNYKGVSPAETASELTKTFANLAADLAALQ